VSTSTRAPSSASKSFNPCRNASAAAASIALRRSERSIVSSAAAPIRS
jgi:hypothetical protein